MLTNNNALLRSAQKMCFKQTSPRSDRIQLLPVKAPTDFSAPARAPGHFKQITGVAKDSHFGEREWKIIGKHYDCLYLV